MEVGNADSLHAAQVEMGQSAMGVGNGDLLKAGQVETGLYVVQVESGQSAMEKTNDDSLRGDQSAMEKINDVSLHGGQSALEKATEDSLHAGQVEIGALAGAENAWKLNFNKVPRPERDDKPQGGIHDCLTVVVGPGDGVAEYYQQQDMMLEGFTEMDAVSEHGYLLGMSEEDRQKVARSERTAIRISNLANVVLFALKIYATISSRSLAILASTLDSLLDLLSGFILWFTTFKMRTPNPYLYPIGKKRMQPLGILVFASVMATLGVPIMAEAFKQLALGKRGLSSDEYEWHWIVGIMVSVTLVKLFLAIYCRTSTNEIVKAFAKDHFFDVITNSIGLLAAVLARKFQWWMDPAGAIVLALYTIRTWSNTVLENVNSLVGKTASPDYLQKLTYLCWNHHKAIQHIDTVRAYTFGSHYFVEVDIVLPSDMSLQMAHDIGEALQENWNLFLT
ncbi:hypothetical protein SUGI_0086310 [Cryptomeria japonica]|nr:hypothetical protein SUGI_0086310 [Cryptomeria japonica]